MMTIMATSSRRASPAAKRAAAPPKGKTSSKSSATKPFIRFYHAEALRTKTLSLLRSLKLAKPGFIVEQSANLGLAGVQQVMGSVVRQIIGRMDGPQLLSVAGSIRQLML